MRKESWLKRYLRYTHRSEANEQFHFWAGVSCIAGVLERSVWIDTGHGYRLYPNMYILLVAKSGKRKTSAADFSIPLLEEVGVTVFREKITNAALTRYLHNQCELDEDGGVVKPAAGFLYTGEAAVLFSRESMVDGLMNTLTSIYLCPDLWTSVTKTQGVDRLYHVCLNLLGATVPDLLAKWVGEVLFSGFMARLIIVTGGEKRKRPLFYGAREEELVLYEELTRDLREMRKLKGEFVVTEECVRFLEAWYANREPPEDERFDGFFEREHDHVLKIAMVLAVSEGKGLVVDVPQAEAAIMAVENIKAGMSEVYAGFGTHVQAEHIARLREQLKEAGGVVPHSVLLRKNWYRMTRDDFNAAIGLLSESGEVVQVRLKGGRGYVLSEVLEEERGGSDD